jgi:hypothetical protein
MSTTYVEVNPQLTSVAVGDTVQVSPIVQSRANTATVTASNLAAGAYTTLNPVAHKGYVLYSITSDKPCWVRLYTDAASRTADENRAQFQAPDANSGLIAEAIFVGAGTVNFTPGVYGYNNESSPTTAAPIAVVNTGNATQSIGVSLQVLKLEQD